METEDKLNMMTAAGFEVTNEPSSKQLRCAKVWLGHELVDRLEYPEAAYDSAMDMLFNFYLIGRFTDRPPRGPLASMDNIFKQQENEMRKQYQNAQQNMYANQAQGLGAMKYVPEQYAVDVTLTK